MRRIAPRANAAGRRQHLAQGQQDRGGAEGVQARRPLLLRRKLIGSQTIESELEDGGLIVSGKVAHPNQILPIVRYWLPNVRIISPEGLRRHGAGRRGVGEAMLALAALNFACRIRNVKSTSQTQRRPTLAPTQLLKETKDMLQSYPAELQGNPSCWLVQNHRICFLPEGAGGDGFAAPLPLHPMWHLMRTLSPNPATELRDLAGPPAMGW